MTARKDPKDHLPPGPKPILADPALGPEVRTKIEEAAAFGASLEEIAFYAGVHRNTLRNWCIADPELRGRIEELREKPVLKARETVVKALATDSNMAMRYLEKKRPAEFGQKVGLEVKGTVEHKSTEADPAGVQLAVQAFEEAMRRALTGPRPEAPPAIPVVAESTAAEETPI